MPGVLQVRVLHCVPEEPASLRERGLAVESHAGLDSVEQAMRGVEVRREQRAMGVVGDDALGVVELVRVDPHSEVGEGCGVCSVSAHVVPAAAQQ